MALDEYLEVRSDLGRSVRVFLDALCICGSPKALRTCCFRDDKIVERSAPSATTPPGHQTMHANPKCYARALNDCDPKVSKEHYFSKGVTRAVAGRGASNTVRFARPDGTELEVPPDQAFQAKILCRRHNSALSELDVVGERLFRSLQNGLVVVPSYPFRSLPGRDVERWLLKVSCGVRAVHDLPIPLEWLTVLFGKEELRQSLGLCMYVPLQRRVHGSFGIQFGSFSRDGEPTGSEIRLDGLHFTLDMAGDGRVVRQADSDAVRLYRPAGIWFDHGGSSTFHLAFAWGDELASTQSVVIEIE